MNTINKEFIPQFISKENPTILEIGCNDGGHTSWFLELFKSPKIFCFEPDPRAILRFKRNIGKRSEVTLYECAVSDIDGQTVFYMSSGRESEAMPDGWDYSGSIHKPKNHLIDHPWCKFEKEMIVNTKRLDTWYKEKKLDIIDFIWMDVQGAEIDVIRGGMNTLKNVRYLYTEYNDNEQYEGQVPLKQLLRELPGFKIINKYPDDVLFKNMEVLKC